MNNEIKEINITFPGQILDYVDTKEHLLELFNYITNLQEEKVQLKGKIKNLEHNCKQAEDSCRQHRLASKNHIRRLDRREKQINLYKSRNEKAIRTLETLKSSARWERYLYEVDYLLNILNGGDDNE